MNHTKIWWPENILLIWLLMFIRIPFYLAALALFFFSASILTLVIGPRAATSWLDRFSSTFARVSNRDY